MKKVIQIEHISKSYRLGELGTGTISRDIDAWLAKLRGKENPNLKIGQGIPESAIHCALNDVSFDVFEGDVVGIIGKNGAGKSTLLKILSRVTMPTSGQFKVKGRVASLLEVGTGFHPDLTGRDNVYLNGAILGMKKAEIKNKFDEIINFSGVEKFIDTPVKRYSSGMYVRLAFAVAAHLEPEILVVDEVLAVGDIAFQNKCLGKMSEVSKQGRTILFVSHNMQAMSKLCTRGILMENGKLSVDCLIDDAIKKYLTDNSTSDSTYIINKPDDSSQIKGYVFRIQIEDLNGNLINEIPVGKPWRISIFFEINELIKHFIIGLNISDVSNINVNTSFSNFMDIDKGSYRAIFLQDEIFFSIGTYNLSIGLSSYENSFSYLSNAAKIVIADTSVREINKQIIRTSGVGLILNSMKIDIQKL